jgi:hypothetical protein
VRNIIAMGRVVASIGAVALITTLYFEMLHVNPTTVALSYLIAILVIATTWGIVEATGHRQSTSGRARQREIDAAARQRDLERLYAFSRALLLIEGGGSVPGAIARHIADTFERQTVGLYDRRGDTVS